MTYRKSKYFNNLAHFFDSLCSWYDIEFENFGYWSHGATCGVRSGDATKRRDVILDFDMLSEIITFELKGRFGRKKHQNLGVKVKVVA